MTRKKGSDRYEVDYGRPPKQHQFTPGRSGNPKGRPKASRNVGTVLHDKLLEELTISRNGRRVAYHTPGGDYHAAAPKGARG